MFLPSRILIPDMEIEMIAYYLNYIMIASERTMVRLVLVIMILTASEYIYSQNMDIMIEAERNNIRLVQEMARQSEIDLANSRKCWELFDNYFESARNNISNLAAPDPSKYRLEMKNKAEVRKLLDLIKRNNNDCIRIYSANYHKIYWRNVFESDEFKQAKRSEANYLKWMRDKENLNFIENPIWIPWAGGNGRFESFSVLLNCYLKGELYEGKQIIEFMYSGGFIGFNYFEASGYFSHTLEWGANGQSSHSEVHPEQLRSYMNLRNYPDWYINSTVDIYIKKYYKKFNSNGITENPLWWK